MSNKALVPESKNGLSKFKTEVAQELGVPFKDYNGDLSARQCGSVGGEMVKRMVEQYENSIKKKKKNNILNNFYSFTRKITF